MKKIALLYFLAASLLFGAAADVKIEQKNAQGTGFAPVIVAPQASSVLFFDAQKIPTTTATANTSYFLRGDMTWQAIPGGGDMLASNNLGDVADKSTSLFNLGGAPMATSALAQTIQYGGTAGSMVTGVPAFGTSNHTIVARARTNSIAATQIVCAAVASYSPLFVNSTGELRYYDGTTGSILLASGIVANRDYTFAVVSEGIGTDQKKAYVDGVLVKSFASANDQTNAITRIGHDNGGNYWNGALTVDALNRALSLAEIQALMRSGPAKADLPSTAAGTALITGDNSTFASDTLYWAKSAGTTIGSGSCVMTGAGDYIYKTSLVTVGSRYRLALVNTSGSGNVDIYIGDGNKITTAYAASIVIEGVATTSGTITVQTSAALTIDTLTLVPLGFTLLPDPTNEGLGTSWSSVANVPGSISAIGSGNQFLHQGNLVRQLGGGATMAGNLSGDITLTAAAGRKHDIMLGSTTLLNPGGNNRLMLNPASLVNPALVDNSDYALVYTSGAGGALNFNGHLVLQPRTSANGSIIFASGNGTTIERGRIDYNGIWLVGNRTAEAIATGGILQLPTGGTAASGLGLHTGTVLYGSAAGTATLTGALTTTGVLTVQSASKTLIGASDAAGVSMTAGQLEHLGTYGNIYVADASAAQTVPTGASYTKLTCFTAAGPSNDTTVSHANDQITLTRAGKYMVTISWSGAWSDVNGTGDFAAFLDTTEQNQIHASRKFSSTDVGSLCAAGIVTATANQVLTFQVKHDDGGNVDVTTHDCSMSVFYLGR